MKGTPKGEALGGSCHRILLFGQLPTNYHSMLLQS